MPAKPQNLLRSRCLRHTVGARSGSLPLSPQIFLPLVHAHHRHIASVRKYFCAKADSASPDGDQQTSSARSRVPISPIVRFFHLCG
jgi:hypothetical protein